jgi:hypothetical protein
MTRTCGRLLAFFLLVVGAAPHPCTAQITPADVVFARLSSSTVRMAYVERGGDMSSVKPLLDEAGRNALGNPVAAYRDFYARHVVDECWQVDAGC